MLHEPTIKLSNRTAGADVVISWDDLQARLKEARAVRTAQTHFGPVTLDANQQQEFKAWMTSGDLTMGPNILQAIDALPNGADIRQALEQKDRPGVPHTDRNRVNALIAATPQGRAFIGSWQHQNAAAERFSQKPDRLRDLKSMPDYTAYHLMASGNVVGDDMLHLATNPNVQDRTLALMVKHPKAIDYLLGRIQDHKNKGPLVDQALAERQPILLTKPWRFKRPPQQAKILAGLQDPAQLKDGIAELADVEMALAGAISNPNQDIVDPILVKSKFPSIREEIAKRVKDVGTLETLANPKTEQEEEVRGACVNNPNYLRIEGILSSDPSNNIRKNVADKTVDPQILTKLAGDKDSNVRMQVAKNEASPPDAINILITDNNTDIAKTALKHKNADENAKLRAFNGTRDPKFKVELASFIPIKKAKELLMTGVEDDVNVKIAERTDLTEEDWRAIWPVYEKVDTMGASKVVFAIVTNPNLPEDIEKKAAWLEPLSALSSPALHAPTIDFLTHLLLEGEKHKTIAPTTALQIARGISDSWNSSENAIATIALNYGNELPVPITFHPAAAEDVVRFGINELAKGKSLDLVKAAEMQIEYLQSPSIVSGEELRNQGMENGFDCSSITNIGDGIPLIRKKLHGTETVFLPETLEKSKDNKGKLWASLVYASDPNNEFSRNLFKTAGDDYGFVPGNGKPIGWIGGSLDRSTGRLFVNEIRSPLMESLGGMKDGESRLKVFSQQKSQIELSFKGWKDVFLNQALRVAQEAGAKELMLPLSHNETIEDESMRNLFAEAQRFWLKGEKTETSGGWAVIPVSQVARKANLSRRSAQLYVGQIQLSARQYGAWVNALSGKDRLPDDALQVVRGLSNFSDIRTAATTYESNEAEEARKKANLPSPLSAALQATPGGQSFLDSLQHHEFMASPIGNLRTLELKNFLKTCDDGTAQAMLGHDFLPYTTTITRKDKESKTVPKVDNEQKATLLAQNPNLSDETLAELAHHIRLPKDLQLILRHPNAGPLAAAAVQQVQQAASQNPAYFLPMEQRVQSAKMSTSPAILTALSTDPNPRVRAEVAVNLHTPEPVLSALRLDKNLSVSKGVARNTSTSTTDIDWLITSYPHDEVKEIALHNPKATEGVVNGMVKSSSAVVVGASVQSNRLTQESCKAAVQRAIQMWRMVGKNNEAAQDQWVGVLVELIKRTEDLTDIAGFLVSLYNTDTYKYYSQISVLVDQENLPVEFQRRIAIDATGGIRSKLIKNTHDEEALKSLFEQKENIIDGDVDALHANKVVPLGVWDFLASEPETAAVVAGAPNTVPAKLMQAWATVKQLGDRDSHKVGTAKALIGNEKTPSTLRAEVLGVFPRMSTQSPSGNRVGLRIAKLGQFLKPKAIDPVKMLGVDGEQQKPGQKFPRALLLSDGTAYVAVKPDIPHASLYIDLISQPEEQSEVVESGFWSNNTFFSQGVKAVAAQRSQAEERNMTRLSNRGIFRAQAAPTTAPPRPTTKPGPSTKPSPEKPDRPIWDPTPRPSPRPKAYS